MHLYSYITLQYDIGLNWLANSSTQTNRGRKIDLVVFTDSDYAGDLVDQKEAEFVATAAAACACEAIWLRKVLEEIHFKRNGSTTIYRDSSSAIKLSENAVQHRRSKHIEVKFHFLRTKDGVIDLTEWRCMLIP
ncbi:hypothetical protein CQW23_13738 [Capsicum baccatum]|uniref:Retrovirus-related Pol polyprotein from transposon TNT 1-94 n=1 Tax=Capsicum baccatum TaxID=33114 RepID=A0A2G2WHF8_CAPBA|nr:hypothetical protein CQW23_13738 [Capsicum baccatum]